MLFVSQVGAEPPRVLCINPLTNLVVARPPASTAVRDAFQVAEAFERAGQTKEAKTARLALAKEVAKAAKIEWPAELSDDEAMNLIWAAHTLVYEPRKSGLPGATAHFARYLKSNDPELAGFRKKFGPVLAKALLRRGVAGQEQAFLSAIADRKEDRLPRLQYADWLQEHDRVASAELLRLRCELEELPVARREFFAGRIKELEPEALREWRESGMATLLASVGDYKELASDGLPVLTTHSHGNLLGSTPEQQRAITGLKVAGIGWGEAQIQRLTQLELNQVRTLDFSYIAIGDAGVRHLAAPGSVFKNVTSLDLTHIRIGDAGARHLAAPDSVFKGVTSLRLSHNEIGNAGARHLAAPTSVFKNVTFLDLTGTQIGDAGSRYLATPTSVFKSVTALGLAHNEIGDAGARHLAAPTSVFKGVTILDLSFNEIGDAGARHLAAPNSVFKKLTILYLGENEIGYELYRATEAAMTSGRN